MSLPARPRLRRGIALALAAAALLAVGSGAQAVTNGLPDSIAAIGDSITQAANADLLHLGGSNPGESWSTGYDPLDGVTSHYERLVARNPAVADHTFNDAVSGAKMEDAPAQATAAVQQRAEYVTVLMGANDVCAPSKDAMTSVTAYEASFRQTMTTLATGLPSARILVVSIPDVYRLWETLKGNVVARLVWGWFRICPSMLSETNTEADRQFVRARNIDFNHVLRAVCGEYAQCRYDDDRVFNYRFTPSEVSGVDYFHPSLAGQRTLAELTWSSGFWPS